jgi:hypothetical protein
VLDDGSVDDRATAALVEIALPVELSRQQIWEEDLSSALLQFRRRATQLGQIEDWFIFNGTYPSIQPNDQNRAEFARQVDDGHPLYRPDLRPLNAPAPGQWTLVSGTPKPIAGGTHDLQLTGMRQRNPGSLGLIEGPRVQRAQQADRPPLNNNGLMEAIVGAINSLENNGYVAPYVCVFGRNPFEAAFESIPHSTVLPRDRIEPLIGRELLHASGIDILPQSPDLYVPTPEAEEEWRSRGVLLSMANDPIDLALAAEATPEFRQVDMQGHYVFSVFERFALRIKDVNAIVALTFESRAETERREAERREAERRAAEDHIS